MADLSHPPVEFALVQCLCCAWQWIETGDDCRFEVDGGCWVVAGVNPRGVRQPLIAISQQRGHAVRIGRGGENRSKVVR